MKKESYRVISFRGEDIARFLEKSDRSPRITIYDEEIAGSMQLLETLHTKILSRLYLMRDVCLKVTTVPMTNLERQGCQREVARLTEEIETLAGGIAQIAQTYGEEGVPLGENLSRDLDLLDASVLGIINKMNYFESRGDKNLPVIGRENQKNNLDDEKITNWMNSFMKKWGV